MPPLPQSKAFGEDERSVLLGYLNFHRVVLARKVGGITEDQARVASCPPSDMTLLGLIRHMADVERFWFRQRLVGEDIEPIYETQDEPDRDWHFSDADTIAQALTVWHQEMAVADANLADVGMGDYEASPVGGQPVSTVRRVVTHLIEEYARHCGHADLIRQAIDGTTGDWG